MNKKAQIHIPLALLIIVLFVTSFLVVRFNSVAIGSNLKTFLSRISGGNPSKNLGDSKFVAAAATVDSLDNCNIDIKLNNSKLEQIPGAPANVNPNVKRFTYKSVDNIKVDGGQKFGSVDIACVNFESTIKQLTASLEAANKNDTNKITELFGMPYAELSKLDGKTLYKMFIIKRAAANDCKEATNTSEIASVNSDLEKRLDKTFVDCTYKYKNNDGVEDRIIKYKYMFDKDSKFLLQVGESDADLLRINDQFLLINKL